MSSIVDHWYARSNPATRRYVAYHDGQIVGEGATPGDARAEAPRGAKLAVKAYNPRTHHVANDGHRSWLQADEARSNPLFALSLKTGASKRIDQDRKTLLMAIYKRLRQVGDGRIVAGKHVVMHAPSGHRTFVLEDMTMEELRELGGKLAGRRANPKTIAQSSPITADEAHQAYLRKQKGYRELDVKAIDNHGHKYPVVVYNSDSRAPTLRGKMVLQIVGTPGSWFLTTITEKGIPARMSIDFGSGWTWDNVREVVAAI